MTAGMPYHSIKATRHIIRSIPPDDGSKEGRLADVCCPNNVHIPAPPAPTNRGHDRLDP